MLLSPRFASALLAGLAAVASACKPGLIDEPVSLSADVPEAAVAHVAALNSVDDSIDGASGRVKRASGGLVVATNASGETLLAAFEGNSGALEVGVRTSAEASVRMLLQPPLVTEAQAKALRGSIASHPVFPALVDEIAAAAAEGRPYIEVESTTEKIALIARDLIASVRASSSSKARAQEEETPGDVEVYDLPLVIRDGELTGPAEVVNSSRLWFHARVIDEQGNIISKTLINPIRAPEDWTGRVASWLQGETPVSTAIGVPATGTSYVTFSQNIETRELVFKQMVGDVAQLCITAMGLSDVGPVEEIKRGLANALWKQYRDQLGNSEATSLPETVQSIVGTFGEDGSWDWMKDQMSSIIEKYLEKEGGSAAKAVGLKALMNFGMKNILVFLKYEELIADLSDMSPFYVDWHQHAEKEQSVEVCLEGGNLVACPCPAPDVTGTWVERCNDEAGRLTYEYGIEFSADGTFEVHYLCNVDNGKYNCPIWCVGDISDCYYYYGVGQWEPTSCHGDFTTVRTEYSWTHNPWGGGGWYTHDATRPSYLTKLSCTVERRAPSSTVPWR